MLEQKAKELGIKYFLVSFSDLFGTQRSEIGAGRRDQRSVRNGGRVRRLRHLARHDSGRSRYLRHAGDRQPGAIALEAQIGWLAADLYMNGEPLPQGAGETY